jgi:glycosyltransferase involved in cell wall biosynthesis
VFDLARHLQAKGVETLLVTRPATRAGDFPGEVVTVPYATVSVGRHGRVLDRTLNYPGFAARAGEVVAQEVRAGRIDVVHAQGLTALGYARLRRKDRALQAPLVMNPQGMEEHKASGWKSLALGRLKWLSREAARLSDRVIATDEATRGEVERLLGVPAARVAVVPNGIDLDAVRAATPACPDDMVHAAVPELQGAFPVFLSVGRIEAYKGFGEVLQALVRLHEGGLLPARWRWVVVGEGGVRDALERRLLALGIAARAAGRTPPHEHVRFLGRVVDELLHALYERADVFVHATRYEGSSLVTLEAMAHGLAVVATRAGGIPDKVVDGETGRLVEPRDVEALATALAELTDDAARRAAMGERARARVCERFAWPAIAERTLALYAELRAETRAGGR